MDRSDQQLTLLAFPKLSCLSHCISNTCLFVVDATNLEEPTKFQWKIMLKDLLVEEFISDKKQTTSLELVSSIKNGFCGGFCWFEFVFKKKAGKGSQKLRMVSHEFSLTVKTKTGKTYTTKPVEVLLRKKIKGASEEDIRSLWSDVTSTIQTIKTTSLTYKELVSLSKEIETFPSKVKEWIRNSKKIELERHRAGSVPSTEIEQETRDNFHPRKRLIIKTPDSNRSNDTGGEDVNSKRPRSSNHTSNATTSSPESMVVELPKLNAEYCPCLPQCSSCSICSSRNSCSSCSIFSPCSCDSGLLVNFNNADHGTCLQSSSCSIGSPLDSELSINFNNAENGTHLAQSSSSRMCNSSSSETESMVADLPKLIPEQGFQVDELLKFYFTKYG